MCYVRRKQIIFEDLASPCLGYRERWWCDHLLFLF